MRSAATDTRDSTGYVAASHATVPGDSGCLAHPSGQRGHRLGGPARLYPGTRSAVVSQMTAAPLVPGPGKPSPAMPAPGSCTSRAARPGLGSSRLATPASATCPSLLDRFSGPLTAHGLEAPARWKPSHGDETWPIRHTRMAEHPANTGNDADHTRSLTQWKIEVSHVSAPILCCHSRRRAVRSRTTSG